VPWRPGARPRGGHPLTRAARLAWLGALAASGWAGACAAAQVGLSAGVDSDYQWQGLSLSSGEPAVNVSVSGDFRGGLYASLTGVVGATDHDGLRPLAYIADLGYARRLDRGVTADIGVVTSGVRLYQARRYAFTYTQVYGGLSKGDLSAHLFYSPSYLGEPEGALYLDIDGAARPAPGWRLTAHVGGFATLSRSPPEPTERPRLDLRAGIVRQLGSFEGHLLLTTTLPEPIYPTRARQPRRAVVLGASYAF
jgi:hypothetical protein